MNNWKNNKNSPRFVDYPFYGTALGGTIILVSPTPSSCPTIQETEPLYNH